MKTEQMHIIEGRFPPSADWCTSIQPDIGAARLRERQIKGMSRAKKGLVIATINREWHDLSENIGSPGNEVETAGTRGHEL